MQNPTTDFLWEAMVMREVQWFREVSKNQNHYVSVKPDNLSKDLMCSLKPGLSPKLPGHIQDDQRSINIKLTNDTCTEMSDFSTLQALLCNTLGQSKQTKVYIKVVKFNSCLLFPRRQDFCLLGSFFTLQNLIY